MKKQELEDTINKLNEIKTITDKLSYNVIKEINPLYNSINNTLNKELLRMDSNAVEVNSPAIAFTEVMNLNDEELNSNILNETAYKINDTLENLVLQDFKIIDFGIQKINELPITLVGYIKYTN